MVPFAETALVALVALFVGLNGWAARRLRRSREVLKAAMQLHDTYMKEVANITHGVNSH